MLERWKNAVVHLECVRNSVSFEDHFERKSELQAQLDNGEISVDVFDEVSHRGIRDVRFHGTALFILHEGRRYLLTARHVLFDEQDAETERQVFERVSSGCSADERERVLAEFKKRVSKNIFPIIFRVPSINEVLKDQPALGILMNLGAGHPDFSPYTFSDPNLDLALISLDARHDGFANELTARGYIPIPSTDIGDGPDFEGQELFAVGFPSSTALLGQLDLPPAVSHWSSSDYSLPISSFGRVAMLHTELPFFWADISIYPGNSGGPVVANDRLVGIVSAQATLAIDDVPHVRTRIPFGRIIKSSYVHDLLKEQIQKDRPMEEHFGLGSPHFGGLTP